MLKKYKIEIKNVTENNLQNQIFFSLFYSKSFKSTKKNTI